MHNSFFEGGADGIIDAHDVDYEYDGEEEDDYLDDESKNCGESVMSSSATEKSTTSQTKSTTWAKLVNPAQASCAPSLNYSLAASPVKLTEQKLLDVTSNVITKDNQPAAVDDEEDGQFDDASEEDLDNDNNSFDDSEE